MTTHHPNSRRLVYGYATMHDCLAFADAGTATEEAAEIRALAAARTWGEARQVRMTHLWNPAGPEYHEPEDGYADDKAFDITEVGAVGDGTWPRMAAVRAFTLLPKDLQERYGKRELTLHDGDYLEIALASEGELVAELRRRGYEVSRDDELINLLDGFSLGSQAS
ncbi:hypothetical protein [Micromonospora parathelypteridis]|uniref:Uncharacterized protein n=1 Tax=Micromonospora parathelypteridis TaxID=1839617 RepID=A0A840VP95_9ACTN|nr:hypothetical protein [Micromonospora parathelypteridis]MBB5475864.1 hypothetical protein [Micromonospora parathelypteridis]GGO31805.1 hypothetical protein GCM10011576_61210 [Micromonospora parathelypteridis]